MGNLKSIPADYFYFSIPKNWKILLPLMMETGSIYYRSHVNRKDQNHYR
jgi:hypothetical protein